MKLHASYRGSFVVIGFAGSHNKSHILRQVNGQKKKIFLSWRSIEAFQTAKGNLRAGKSNHDVPCPTTYFEGAWTKKK
ncbi:hypothetical protein OnM2_013011 [Erysiphe neolycopersici]|uniref:Uncharacterized protein n=1 Tax=Erysiphe neolycopersici TaxID=212602 RepID=A0A420I5U8_9PEZI|nr:hypothetical protein OnM2_013011 [Erysiphe neolycopersici]